MLAYNLTSKELAKNTPKLAILPVGSIEQHGPFLPLGTDSIFANDIAKSLEEKIGDKVVIYPTLVYGCAKEHKAFPGTIYLEFETYMKLVRDIIRSIFQAGFSKLLIINTHGGNERILLITVADWNYDHEKQKAYSVFAFSQAVTDKAAEMFGSMESHAGSVETSMIYAISPTFIKTKIMKRKNKQFIRKPNTGFGTHRADEMHPSGIVSKVADLVFDTKKGKQLLEMQIQELIFYVNKLIGGK